MPLIKKKPKAEEAPAPAEPKQLSCPDHGALPQGAVTCKCGEQGQ